MTKDERQSKRFDRHLSTASMVLSKKTSLQEHNDYLTAIIDPKFLVPPNEFRTMDVVIDVLRGQLDLNENNLNSLKNQDRRKFEDKLRKLGKQGKFVQSRTSNNLGFAPTGDVDMAKDLFDYKQNNPMYDELVRNDNAVNEAIDFMVMNHVEALNKDVSKVAEVSGEFQSSIKRVSKLRHRVQEIKAKLGGSVKTRGTASASAIAKPKEEDNDASGVSSSTGSKTLRELWLHKLECEKVLKLLTMIETIREAPRQFDHLIPPIARDCRIGKATVVLSDALDTFNSGEAVEVYAMMKVSQQMMVRKEKALEILWNSLHEVIYLSNGNGGPMKFYQCIDDSNEHGSSQQQNYLDEGDEDDDSLSETGDVYIEQGYYDDDDENSLIVKDTYARIDPNARTFKDCRMISVVDLERQVNIVKDELKCLDQTRHGRNSRNGTLQLTARYTDSVLALRIIVDSLHRLNNVDDVGRVLKEKIKDNLRKLTDNIQDRTLLWMQKQEIDRRSRDKVFLSSLPTELHRHFSRILIAYENVFLRLCHLAQIIRQKKMMSVEFINTARDPEEFFTALQENIDMTEKCIQEEVKIFLQACLNVSESSSTMNFIFNRNPKDSSKKSSIANLTQDSPGLFSLGIIDEDSGVGPQIISREKKKSDNESSGRTDIGTEKFVSILFSEMGLAPDVRHAPLFRNILNTWNKSIEDMKIELAAHTGGDWRDRQGSEKKGCQTAMEYLDFVIERHLLQILQNDAEKGTIVALEREDAFAPIIPNNIYLVRSDEDRRSCFACEAFLNSTTPLFTAINQLPSTGVNLTKLIDAFVYSSSIFIGRVKNYMNILCRGKSAHALLGGGEGGNGGKLESKYSLAIKERSAFKEFMLLYGFRVDRKKKKTRTSIPTLKPSTLDSKARYANNDNNNDGNHTAIQENDEDETKRFLKEIKQIANFLNFSKNEFGRELVVCTAKETNNCATLADSLLRLAQQLDSALKCKSRTRSKALNSNKSLESAILTIRVLGIRMALFCRVDIIVHTIKHMARLCTSGALSGSVARTPSCVTSLGEYLALTSDTIHEIAGSALCTYSVSSLEEYIPLLLMRVVETIGLRDGSPPWCGDIPLKITIAGVASLEKCRATLQRELKSIADFEGSFWNERIANESFEHAASYISLIEKSGDELLAYLRSNWGEFTDNECRAMFAINGPRRKGDRAGFDILREQMASAASKSRRL